MLGSGTGVSVGCVSSVKGVDAAGVVGVGAAVGSASGSSLAARQGDCQHCHC